MTSTSNKYRSKFEASIAATLHAKNVAFTYETIRLEYTLEGTYVPDFILPSGVLVEAKGHLRTEDRRKLRAVKTQHPHLDIRLCFQNANEKISKKKIVCGTTSGVTAMVSSGVTNKSHPTGTTNGLFTTSTRRVQ